MKAKIKENLAFVFIFGIIILLLFNPSFYSKSALRGFALWANVVLPSLFPYLFLTQLLTSNKGIEKFSNKLAVLPKTIFHAPPIFSYAMLMSFLSGYPVGAKITLDLYEKGAITEREAEKLSIIASTSGVSFVVGVMGGVMAKNVILGIVMYFSHIFSAVIMGIIFRDKEAFSPRKVFFKGSIDNVLEKAIYSSTMSILMVGGYIAFFFVISDLVLSLKLLVFLENFFSKILSAFSIEGEGIIRGIIEATSGISSVFSSSNNVKTASVISVMMITFGGISINLQNLTFLTKAKVKATTFLLKKLLQSVIAGILCYVTLLFV